MKRFKQMFVIIDNKDMSVTDVDTWIKTTRDDNGGVISPGFAMEILSKTNFYGNIKKVLGHIKVKCKTKKEVLPYQKFLLSCVDEREMSDLAMADLRELADLCDCRKELEEINKKPKFYKKDDCKNIIKAKAKSKLDMFRLEGKKFCVLWEQESAYLNLCDLTGYKIKFKEGMRLKMARAVGLQGIWDFSPCSEVDLSNASGLNGVLDFSSCCKVDLHGSYLVNVEGFKFGEGAEVNLRKAYPLPETLDLSMCAKADMTGCNLEKVKLIKFKDKEQEKEFMQDTSNFRGKIVYSSDLYGIAKNETGYDR